MPKRRPVAGEGASVPLTTYQLVTLALYLEGGELQSVDTEDIAVRVNALAPGRFTWRKFQEQIDLNAVMISLRHAKRAQNGQLVSGEAKAGWRLTDAGVQSARRASASGRQEQSTKKDLSKAEERWARIERNRLLSEEAFLKFAAGAAHTISRGAAEKFFRLDDYIQGERRAAFVTRICSVFGKDRELSAALIAIRAILEGDSK